MSGDGWEPTGDPLFEFNGLLRFWRQIEGKVRLVVDVGTGSEPTFPDNGSIVQHCFEPEPKAFDRLSQFARPHMHMHRLAVGDRAASGVPFYCHGETLHPRSVLSCRKDCDCQIKVDVTSLDAHIAKNPSLDGATIDVLSVLASGHEKMVLQGATNTLKHTSIVLFEYGGTWRDSGVRLNEALDILKGAGFGFLGLVAPHAIVPVTLGEQKDDHVLRYFVAARSPTDISSLSSPIPTPKLMEDGKYGQRFVHVPVIPSIHAQELPVAPSFNLAITTDKPSGGYMGLLRRTRNPNGGWGNRLDHAHADRKYPESESTYSLLTLDRTFRVLREVEMKEANANRTRHQSYSTGLEDCRWVDDNLVLATTLDTNPHWKAEMSIARFSPISGEITDVRPVNVRSTGTEKNWLHLRHWGPELHVLHWCNPLRVLRIDSSSAEGHVIKEVSHPLLNIKAHGGAAMQLQDGTFLVTVREYRRSHYAHSRWIRLNDQYDPIGVSPPFRFQNKYYYEMCMSLCTSTTNPSHIVAAVCFEDRVQFIFTFLLDTVLRTLKQA